MFRALGALRRLLAGPQLELALPGATRAAVPPAATPVPVSGRGAPPRQTHTTAVHSAHHPPNAAPSVSPPADSAAGLLDRLRAIGLTGIDHCTLTRNHSTVVSFRGPRLRVHHALLDAPPDVLRSLVDFVNGRGAARHRARRALLAFHLPVAGSPRERRREASHPADAPLVARLVDAHRQLNHERFDGLLRDVTIRVSRRMRSRLGHFSAGPAGSPPEIAIARRHIRRDGWSSAVDTLVHEMVHQWQFETRRALAHDRAFRAKARLVGIHGGARRAQMGSDPNSESGSDPNSRHRPWRPEMESDPNCVAENGV